MDEMQPKECVLWMNNEHTALSMQALQQSSVQSWHPTTQGNLRTAETSVEYH
jgi:hypothetical protein